jgi:hypothetical protein
MEIFKQSSQKESAITDAHRDVYAVCHPKLALLMVFVRDNTRLIMVDSAEGTWMLCTVT